MTNKVYLNADGLIEIEVIGDQNLASIEAMARLADGLLTEQKRVGKPALVLDNLLQIGSVDAEGRKLVVELGKRLDYDKLAMLGKGGIMRFGTNLMLRATGRSYKLRYFDDRQEAIAWLQTKK
ncbi:MAG TPA: STAS/SEC14 domain-containing protein [Patescibacteria group bacterium]|nr:STAS/SEC14 domain-containing protein [Patescibacteria group bacterium]